MSFVEKTSYELAKYGTAMASPQMLPPLLPTLQTNGGNLKDNGRPKRRKLGYVNRDNPAQSKDQVTRQCSLPHRSAENIKIHSYKTPGDDLFRAETQRNFEVCAVPIDKNELIRYIRHGKRVDIEQAVAMVIGYLHCVSGPTKSPRDLVYDSEYEKPTVVNKLLSDLSTTNMLTKTCMWREPLDYEGLDSSNPRETTKTRIKKKILTILANPQSPDELLDQPFIATLQSIRRRRTDHRLTLPDDLLPDDAIAKESWSFTQKYQLPFVEQDTVVTANTQVFSKRRFRKVQRLLFRLQEPTDPESLYFRDVRRIIETAGGLTHQRIAALEASTDRPAIAYSFIAAQRRYQPKVVNKHKWTHLFVREEAVILQNRPDVLTSFEDILVQHARDLKALTAIACPKGMRDHFSAEKDIKDRTKKLCELMDFHVQLFGLGEREYLALSPPKWRQRQIRPVDIYNVLYDELKDCRNRAKAIGVDLEIAPTCFWQKTFWRLIIRGRIMRLTWARHNRDSRLICRDEAQNFQQGPVVSGLVTVLRSHYSGYAG